MGKYLDPKYDLTFKRVFGEHKHLCISLINSMLPLDEDQEVVEIEYETGEMLPQLEILKFSIVDVRCTDNTGRQFIVEMQMEWTESFKSRVLLNASKAYVRQLDSAQQYKLLRPVYAINFVNDTFEALPEMKDEYYHHYRIVNLQHTEQRIEGLEFVFIELQKFKPTTRATRKLHELWLRFLTEINEHTKEAPPELLSDEYVGEAMHHVEVGAYSKKQLLAYDEAKMAVMTARSILLETEEKGRAEGLEEGLAKGREGGLEEGLAKGLAKGREGGLEEGLTKGLAKGREEGLEEGLAKGRAEVAVNALKKGISPEDVHEFTGLPLNEILKLKNDL
ncbi:MAG: Rpn family recombination-promoting nuclease/putative transposase [Prevotellaceae bacterium]|jgi:predicted transposase/invertase (TIGR01784 family)|nr:Rpn family recombination-promoting nuclease/putative transposase [Prevotellaceae bacterium]